MVLGSLLLSSAKPRAPIRRLRLHYLSAKLSYLVRHARYGTVHC